MPGESCCIANCRPLISSGFRIAYGSRTGNRTGQSKFVASEVENSTFRNFNGIREGATVVTALFEIFIGFHQPENHNHLRARSDINRRFGSGESINFVYPHFPVLKRNRAVFRHHGLYDLAAVVYDARYGTCIHFPWRGCRQLPFQYAPDKDKPFWIIVCIAV